MSGTVAALVNRVLARLTLRSRIVGLSLFATIPAFVLAQHVAEQARDRTAFYLQEDALRLAHKVAAEQDAAVEATRQLLSALAAVPEIQHGSDCGSLMGALAANPAYAEMVVVDERGSAICGLPLEKRSYADTPWFRQAVSGGQFVFGGHQPAAPGGRAVAVAALPLLGDDGEARRVLAAGIDLGWLSQHLAASEHPEASITILGRDGTVLARHPAGIPWVGNHPAVRAALAQQEGTALLEDGGRGQRAFGFAPLGRSDAVVLAGLPTDRAFAEADRIYYRSLIWLSALGLLFLAAAIFASDRLVLRPMARLAAASRQLSRGNLHARTGLPHGDDEVGQLARGFDGMAEAVERMVTERTEALQDSEERFRLAVRFAPLAVFSQDRDLRYTWVQGHSSDIVPEDWLGRTDAEIFTPDDAAEQIALKRRVLETGQGTRQIVTVLWNGERRSYDLMIEPLRDRGGSVAGVMCLGIDVTAERRREVELEAARAAAERANQAKTRFLAAASHDLRQPLQAMQLYLHLLVSKLTTPEQQKLAGLLSQSAAAATSLLDSLMALSALETGQVRPNRQPVAVAPLLERIAAESSAEAAAKGLEVRLRLTEAVAQTDPVLLERMVRNLVKNALRYTDRGRVLIASRRDGDGCRIEVWDTGRGIPVEKQQAIFQEFYQVPGQRPTGEGGLGLGLSTVAHMGRLLDHDIGVRSHPGRGSVFFIRLGKRARRLAA